LRGSALNEQDGGAVRFLYSFGRGGIPPTPPFRPPAEATLSDWTISSFSLAVNSFIKLH